MQETWVQSLGWEDPLEEGMATNSSILAWRIPMDRGAWWAALHRVTKSRTHTHSREGLLSGRLVHIFVFFLSTPHDLQNL